jgi:hypothetical protein
MEGCTKATRKGCAAYITELRVLGPVARGGMGALGRAGPRVQTMPNVAVGTHRDTDLQPPQRLPPDLNLNNPVLRQGVREGGPPEPAAL